jgi:cell wall-associated NlpC family hydrolase
MIRGDRLEMRQLAVYTLALCVLITPMSALAQEAPTEDRVVLGKLGQSIQETRIYKSPNTGSKVYYTCKEFEYLVVNPTKWDRWLEVLLTNGKSGYILSEHVASLPYNVTAPRYGGTASRGEIGKALNYSFQYLGTPYKWGGTNIKSGIDCSAFVRDVFAQIGEELPRTAAEQYKVGKPVERIEDLQPGDRLYFWDKKRGLIGHTGIFIGWREDGGAYFIHSSSNNHGVATDDLREPKWRNLLVAARR